MITSSEDRAGTVGAVVGLVFAGLIAGPWIGRGQVLLLDWVAGPYMASIGPTLGAEGNTLGGSPFVLLLRVLRALLGAWVLSWLPIVAWMPLVGWGVGRLVRRAGWPAAAAAASLACCNPFTLDRLAIGQVGVLWGYAMVPATVLALASEPRHIVAWGARLALIGAAMTAVSPHFFAYWLVVVLVSLPLLPMFRRRAAGAVVALTGALCASCYLFVIREPSVTVDQADLSAYRTRVEPPGLGPTIMTLRGFWRYSVFSPSRSPAAWVLLVLIGAIVALGVASTWRRREVLAIGAAGLIGAVLAAGDQGPFGGLYRLAFERIGPFRILREPQKASALLAVALAVLFGLGVARLVPLLAGRWLMTVGTIVLVAVPLGTAPNFSSLGSKIDVERPSAAWRQADRLVGSGPAGVLALPWHLYMRYPSTRSPVANLAPTRFRAPVVAGDNVELAGLATTSTRQRSQYLEDLFRRGSEMTDFGARIEPAGLGWVLLVKSVDWRSYEWLDQQQDLVRVLETPELSLYRSSAPTDLSPGSASQHGLGSWRVRSPADRPVPLPEVAEGRWVAAEGRVEITEAGAPAVVSAGTTARSSNVTKALVGLGLSATAAGILAVLALGPWRPSLGRWRRAMVARRPRSRS